MDSRYSQTRTLSQWDRLEQSADAANFVVIDGLAIDVDDIIKAIHGKLTDPLLTRAELTTCYGQEYNTDFIERIDEGMQRRIGNLKKEKLRRIKNLLTRSSIPMGNGITEIKLPRREQILIALSRGRLLYSSLAEFIGQFAELTEKESGQVQTAIDEVKGDLAEVQTATYLSSRRLDQVVSSEDLTAVGEQLGITKLGDLPIFLLERAAFEIPPHPDDLQYFEEIRGDRGVHVGFTVEGTIGTVAFAAPVFVLAGSIIAAEQGWIPWEALNVLMRPEFAMVMGAGAATKAALTLSRWTPITNRIRASAHTHAVQKSARALQERYKEIENTINKLKKTGRGRLVILHLREWLLALREGGDHMFNVHEVAQWEREIQSNPALGESFDRFCEGHMGTMNSMEEARNTLEEFRRYQDAVASLPSVEETPQERARRASAAASLKNR